MSRKATLTITRLIVWFILAISILVSAVSDVVMKMQVNDKLPENDRFSWWNRDAWTVARRYQEFYPESFLPLVSLCAFLFSMAFGLTFLFITLRPAN